jgi:hypothetical protein
MKIMVKDDSGTPHVFKSTSENLSDALKRRAQSIINNNEIDADTRAVIRYGLDINDPWLAELVRRAEAGESIFEDEQTLRVNSSKKIAALTDLICRAGDEPETKSAALFVLMATVEHARQAEALAKTAKHIAFSRCCELNLYSMVDAQVSAVENELFASNGLVT